MVFTVASIFISCASKDESENKNIEVVTDSTAKINNTISDTANAGSSQGVGGAAGGAAVSKQTATDGPGAGGGYLAGQKKDSSIKNKRFEKI